MNNEGQTQAVEKGVSVTDELISTLGGLLDDQNNKLDETQEHVSKINFFEQEVMMEKSVNEEEDPKHYDTVVYRLEKLINYLRRNNSKINEINNNLKINL